MGTDVFEIVRPAVFLGQPGFTFVEFTRFATRALGRIGTVEVWDVAIANVSEPSHIVRHCRPHITAHKSLNLPVNLAGIFKETQSNRMNWSITPSFIEEPTRTVEMVEVGFVSFAAEEIHVANLKV